MIHETERGLSQGKRLGEWKKKVKGLLEGQLLSILGHESQWRDGQREGEPELGAGEQRGKRGEQLY